MIKHEPTTSSRSIGINCDEDLIEALDELREIMADEEGLPSRSKIARDLLWAGIGLIKSPDPRAAALLKCLTNPETDANVPASGRSSGVRSPCRRG